MYIEKLSKLMTTRNYFECMHHRDTQIYLQISCNLQANEAFTSVPLTPQGLMRDQGYQGLYCDLTLFDCLKMPQGKETNKNLHF